VPSSSHDADRRFATRSATVAAIAGGWGRSFRRFVSHEKTPANSGGSTREI
jgi:hypothetical protein